MVERDRVADRPRCDHQQAARSRQRDPPEPAPPQQRPGEHGQKQQRLRAAERREPDRRSEQERPPREGGQQHEDDQRRVERLAHQRAVDDDHQRVQRAHARRDQPELLAAHPAPQHTHQRDRRRSAQQAERAVPHHARPTQPRDDREQRRVQRRMPGRGDLLVRQAQPERLDEELPGRQIVGLPVVEPPVAHPRHVPRDGEEVQRAERDAGHDNRAETAGEALHRLAVCRQG